MKTLLIGCGGHASVIIDSFRKQYHHSDLVGILDDNIELLGRRLLGVPVIGQIKRLEELRNTVDYVFVAIGNNRLRKSIYQEAMEIGYRSFPLVDVGASVSKFAHVDEGTFVQSGAIINTNSTIREASIVNTGATIDHNCFISAFAHVSPGVHLAGGVQVGEGTHVGIGSNAIPNVIIGEWTVIGAGSTIVKDMPPRVIAYGTPCQVQKNYN